VDKNVLWTKLVISEALKIHQNQLLAAPPSKLHHPPLAVLQASGFHPSVLAWESAPLLEHAALSTVYFHSLYPPTSSLRVTDRSFRYASLCPWSQTYDSFRQPHHNLSTSDWPDISHLSAHLPCLFISLISFECVISKCCQNIEIGQCLLKFTAIVQFRCYETVQYHVNFLMTLPQIQYGASVQNKPLVSQIMSRNSKEHNSTKTLNIFSMHTVWSSKIYKLE